MDLMNFAIRTISAIFILFAITRLLGKKQISQLTFFEYVTGITIGDLAGFISTNVKEHFMNGFTAMFLWAFIPFMLDKATLKSKKLRDLFEGTSTIVIQDGNIIEENLKKERYTAEELLEQLRGKNVFRMADVEFAILEATGELSVMLKKEHQPVTPADLNMKVNPEKMPRTIIMDGVIMKETLYLSGLSRDWLERKLKERRLTPDKVFLAQVDSAGELYIDLYDN
jgi:uncharacterized membrane protein YcaP (DUF421 family)